MRPSSVGWWNAAAVPLLLTLVATACAPQSSVSGPQSSVASESLPRRITAAMLASPTTISSNSVIAGSGTIQGGDALEELANAGLSTRSNLGELVPQLAEAVPSIENGLWVMLPDGRMETTWRIRRNARWHDGAAFTSSDLLFTARLGQDRDLPVFADSGFEPVESVEGTDPHTLVVRWKRPYIRASAMFTRRFGFPRPEHVLGPVYGESKERVLQLPYWNEEYVGTGPFKVRQWVPGSHVLLEANDQYVLGRPRLDEVEVRFIPDGNALIANLLAGEVQLTLGRNLSLQQALQIRYQWNGTVGVGIKNWIAVWPQLLNPTPVILLDMQFRRALLHAIDRQQLVETLQEGMVPVAHTFLSPTEPLYKQVEASIVRYAYDPHRVAQLLEALGYRRGADGVFQDAAGQRLSLEVRTDGAGGDDAQETAALAVADALRRVGIATDPLIISQAQRLDREFNSTYPGLRVWRLPNDSDDLRRYHSSDAPRPENRFNGGNRSRYINPDFDAQIERYMTSIPLGERVPILGQIIHQMTDQLTVMGLWYNTEPVMIGSRVRNVTARDVGSATEAWNAHEWDVGGLKI